MYVLQSLYASVSHRRLSEEFVSIDLVQPPNYLLRTLIGFSSACKKHGDQCYWLADGLYQERCSMQGAMNSSTLT